MLPQAMPTKAKPTLIRPSVSAVAVVISKKPAPPAAKDSRWTNRRLMARLDVYRVSKKAKAMELSPYMPMEDPTVATASL